MKAYPASYPKPVINDYAFSPDMSLIRTPLDTALKNQRRAHKLEVTLHTATFYLSITDVNNWTAWVHHFGYSWFTLPLVTQHTASYSAKCTDVTARIVSNLLVTPATEDDFTVECELETLGGVH